MASRTGYGMGGIQGLKDVYFMLRCTRDRHDNCIPMRNAAMNSSKQILQAYTTSVEFEGERYCVTGRALVRNGELKRFERNLGKIRSRSARPRGVDKLKVLVGQ